MIRVLINAYACSPSKGSEPGVGWMWASRLARLCDVYVITEGEWRTEIEQAVAALPQKEHLHFYYNPVSPRVRRMCWNQGDWRFYWHYRRWQKSTLKMARALCEEKHIDIIHQLNMVGFREPGYLWRILGPRYVWGPYGGSTPVPMAYMHEAGTALRLKYYLKNFINNLQFRFSPRVAHAIRRADALIAATEAEVANTRRYYHREAVQINETGIEQTAKSEHRFAQDGLFNVVFVARLVPRKQLPLALHTMARLKDCERLRLHVLGSGPQEEYGHRLAARLGLGARVVWHGQVSHAEAMQAMQRADVLFFPSIHEATSTVVLEAISYGLPVVCFDTCGFGPIVTSKIGRKIALSRPARSVEQFAAILRELYLHPEQLKAMSAHCAEAQKPLFWDEKIARVFDIYRKVLDKG